MSTEQIRLADFEAWCDWLDGKTDCELYGRALRNTPAYLKGFAEQYEMEQRHGTERPVKTAGH